MRRGFVLAAITLSLTGCYLPSADYAQPEYPAPDYGQPQYPPPGYTQPGYPPPGYAQPAYPPPGYDPYANVYPGYSENGGAPTLLVDGAIVPLIVVGGGWGYWDSRHNWHRVPDAVEHHLEQRHAAGGGFRPGPGGFEGPRLEGHPPPSDGHSQGQSSFRPSGFHPPEQARPPASPTGATRPPPSSQPARVERGHDRDCPPGQRC